MYGLLPPANEVCEGYVFTGVCLSTGGACVVAPGGGGWCMVALGGMHGCSWGACVVKGGVCGEVGACMAKGGMRGEEGGMHGKGGHAWQRGGMRGKGGHAWQGGHVWQGGHAWQRGGRAWYARPVIARAVRILLECILV